MIEPRTLTPSERDRLRPEIQALYRRLDAAISALAPVCQVSGRCCRFEEYGHTLFLSAPEAGLLFADAPPPARPIDDGATCPWQDLLGRCQARDARPLGCRVYFCDPRFDGQAPALTEQFLGDLKGIAESAGVPWDYAPLHAHLRAALAAGGLAAAGSNQKSEHQDS